MALMVVDGMSGPTSLDEQIARFVRRQKIPIYLLVNKCEKFETAGALAAEFWGLGLGNPYPVSGIHGDGIAEVLEVAEEHFVAHARALALARGPGGGEAGSAEVEGREEEAEISIAIVGRPNVGKSSLLNRLMGEERAIVSDIAGTTVDAIDGEHVRDGTTYRFIDTAGVRKRTKVKYGVEFFMVNRVFKALKRAQVALLVIDMVRGVTDQDIQIAERVTAEGCACVIVANKWDAVEKDHKTYLKSEAYLRDALGPVKWAEILLTSAKTGQRVSNIFDACDRAAAAHRRRVPTAVLNEVMRDAILWQAPPVMKAAGQGKMYYCSQVGVAPPTVVMFCNNPKLLTANYRRYLERKFRESLEFTGTPISFHFQAKRIRAVEQDARGSPRGGGGPKPYA